MRLAWIQTFLLSNMILAEAYGSGGEIITLPFCSRMGKAPGFPNMARMTGSNAFCYPMTSTPPFPCQGLAAPSLPLRTKASSHFLFL